MFDRVTDAVAALQRVIRLQWSQKRQKSYCICLQCSGQWKFSPTYCLFQRTAY